MNRALALAAFTGVAAATVAVAPAASAHTPFIAVNCPEGVVVKATAYDSRVTNTWSVTIGGVTQSGTFGSSFAQTFPVPQAGATTAWSATIDAPGSQYDLTRSGTVGPCGTPPPPPPPVTPVEPPGPPVTTTVPEPPKHAKVNVRVVDKCNCYRDSVRLIAGKHATVVKAWHPAKTTWKFKVVADEGYVLPSKVGGSSGWAVSQVYTVTTTNKPCPCKERGDCDELYPGYTPPSEPCRGKDCE